MEVIGQGSIHIYDGQDERPHSPDTEELWQESVVIYLWDTDQDVYAFLRMSQEPNRGPGHTTVWLNAWTPNSIYKHTDDSIPLEEGDVTETALSAGGGLCRYEYDGKHNWTVKDEGVEIELTMDDHHPGFGYYDEEAGYIVSDTAPNHIEATGDVTGKVKVNGDEFNVSGTGWRDHSWGKRNWRGILAHRFFPAMFGKDFNLFCVTLIGTDGKMGKFATLIRNDTVQAANDFDIVAYMGEDGVSNQGGKVTLRLDGETHELHYELLGKSAISLHQDFPCVDGMCKVTMGDRVGVGVSETSNRAQGGSGPPNVFPDSPGVLENGIHPNDWVRPA
jgi:hypothetical protein